MNCPNCHQPLQPNTRFCGTCGQKIESVAPPPPPAPRPMPAASAPTPTPTPTPVAVPMMAAAAAPAGGAPPQSGAASGASAALGGASAAASSWVQATAPGFISRVKNIVLSPKAEWDVIAPESTSVAQLYTGYVMILAALAAVLAFVHMSVLGAHLPLGGGVMRYTMGSGLTTAVMSFVFGLIGVFLVGLIINGLAGMFSAQRDQRQAMKVAAYSLTPAWLSSILALSPVLPTLLQFLAGCYGIYVLYLGLPVVMRAPKERALGYTATVVICTILMGIVFGLIAGGLGIFGSRSGMLGSNSPFGGQTAEQQQAAARDQGATAVGNVIGNMLGTDAQGKAGLGAAISNLAKIGEQSQQQAAQQNGGAAPSTNAPPTATDTQNAVAGAGGLLTALGGALGGPNRAAPVDFKNLSDLLPTSLQGMKRTSAQGSAQGAIGIKTTSATADYMGANGATVHLEIADMSGVSGLMDLANNLVQNTTSQSDSGYEKDVSLNGRSAHEKYDAPNKKGDISMQIAKRFTVDVTGQGVDMAALEQAYSQIDLSRLESMKDQGAQHQ
jgi:hypothetical protein